MKESSSLETKALKILREVSGIEPETEYRFHPTRRWRFDFAFPKPMIAIEIEGGVWTGGRHIHPVGFEKDCEKYNEATKLGWKVYRIPGKLLTIDYITELFEP